MNGWLVALSILVIGALIAFWLRARSDAMWEEQKRDKEILERDNAKYRTEAEIKTIPVSGTARELADGFRKLRDSERT